MALTTISGTITTGVTIDDVTYGSPLTITSSGAVYGSVAVFAASGFRTLVNGGLVGHGPTSLGVQFNSGGKVTNTGTITGFVGGALLASGTVSNGFSSATALIA